MPPKTCKKSIPLAVRRAAFERKFGKLPSYKCPIVWCKNKIDPWSFHVGHNIPESRGGQSTVDNLVPICPSCNLSMSNQYSIDEWNRRFAPKSRCIVM